MNNTYMVFDVESVGLHGEGWQVGWVVVRLDTGEIPQTGLLTCHPNRAEAFGSKQQQATDRRWVAEHCHVGDQRFTHSSPADLRRDFWAAWQDWKERGATLAADVCWPVEANFLTACIHEHGDPWSGPYPLIDIASVRLAVGLDPLATVERQPAEMPAHNALADARQSARLLVEALRLTSRGGA